MDENLQQDVLQSIPMQQRVVAIEIAFMALVQSLERKEPGVVEDARRELEAMFMLLDAPPAVKMQMRGETQALAKSLFNIPAPPPT